MSSNKSFKVTYKLFAYNSNVRDFGLNNPHGLNMP